MGFAASAFSARSLRHTRTLGIRFSKKESESYMNVWLSAMKLTGIPEALLPRNEAEALRLFEIGTICEPPPDFDSIIMAHSLINAAPSVLGVTDENKKKDLLKLAYSVSRALIGDELADELKFPKSGTKFLMMGVNAQTRLNYLFDWLLPGRARRRQALGFVNMMSAAAYEPSGISYRMPDHVYAERSREW